MSAEYSNVRTDVEKFCSEIGLNSLLVQGAGGNVSWKEGDILCIKASGTWLAEASSKDIFVQVDLANLREELGKKNFSVTPIVLGEQSLRPSIETLLHALMPQRFVVHLHAVDILAHLVRQGWDADFQSRNFDPVSWASIDYFKPGDSLAMAVYDVLNNSTQKVDVIFMSNHGVVIGGSELSTVSNVLAILLEALREKGYLERLPQDIVEEISSSIPVGYRRPFDLSLQRLATEDAYFNRLKSDWALYPDHVVFLGATPAVFDSVEQFNAVTTGMPPELIFVRDHGVYVRETFSAAKAAQLRCYYDVLCRQQPFTRLKTLSNQEIAQLLDWDAEKYRSSLAK